MRLLVLTRHPPLADYDGAGAYLWDMLTYFAQAGVRIEVASVWTPPNWAHKSRVFLLPRELRSTADLRFPGVLAFGPWRWFRWGSFRARSLHSIRSVFRPIPASKVHASPAVQGGSVPVWYRPPSASESKFFGRRIAGFRPDVIVANFCWMAPALPRRSKGPRTAILTHDVMSEKLAHRPAAALSGPDPATPEGEAALLSQADMAIAISEPDAVTFRHLLSPSSTKVVVAPMSARLRPAPAQLEIERERILFVGSRNPPNIEGLAWFCSDIWPLIRAALPAAELHVCGDAAATLPNPPPPGILPRGRVADLSPEYHRAAAVVVPLLRGTGIKIKLVEALAHGRPVVTTPVGMQGLNHLRFAVREAADPALFAAHLIQLLRQPDEADKLAAAAADGAARHLSPAACYEPVLAALSAT